MLYRDMDRRELLFISQQCSGHTVRHAILPARFQARHKSFLYYALDYF